MKKTTRRLLEDILLYLGHIAAFTRNDRALFDTDLKTQYAVQRAYEVIGEIVKRLSPAFRDDFSEIEWQSLAAFRDILAHNYDEQLKDDLIWNAVLALPLLRQKIETIIESTDHLLRYDTDQDFAD